MSPKAQTTVAPVGRSKMAEATIATTLTRVPKLQPMASRVAPGAQALHGWAICIREPVEYCKESGALAVPQFEIQRSNQ